MLKKIITLLPTLLLAFSIGCAKEETPITPPVETPVQEEPVVEEPVETPGDVDTTPEEGKQEPLTYADVEISDNVLTYTLKNGFSDEIGYGAAFRIEESDGYNGWEDTLITQDMAFIEIYYAMAPNEESIISTDISVAKELSYGEYRLTKEFNTPNGTQTVRVPFFVTEDGEFITEFGGTG